MVNYEYTIVNTHIENIRAGDIIECGDGIHRTICNKDISSCLFMGVSIRGYNYRSGTLPVKRVVVKHVK